MKNKQSYIVLAVILVALMSLGLLTYNIQRNNKILNSDASKTLGTNDIESYKNFDGDSVSLKDFDGTVRVVNSWASWSPFSKNELQELNRLAELYRDQDVFVIAINRNEDSIRAKRFIEQLGKLEYVNFLMDVDDTFYDRMDGKAMPETLFFDVDGNIVMHARGELTYEQMEQYTQMAIDNK